MNRYENGKIYTLRTFQSDKYYIGSTCMPLSKRLNQHKTAFKQYQCGNRPTSTKAFEIVCFDDCYIELLEAYPCKNKMELLKREGELMRENKDEIVNRNIAGRGSSEYYQDNKEEILKRHRKLKVENKESYKEQQIEYRKKNKDKLKDANKQWYEINKEQIIRKQKEYKQKIAKEKVYCECGSVFSKLEKSRHNKTEKHQKYINNKLIEN